MQPIAIILLVVSLVFVYLLATMLKKAIYDGPRLRKEAELWKSEHEEILKSEAILKNALNQIGEALPPCDKCGSHKLQLWEVDEFVMWTRCRSCKKKFDHQAAEGSNWLETINVALEGVYFLVNTYQNSVNPQIKALIKPKLTYDYFGLRKGSFLCRAVIFESNKKDLGF